MVFFFLCLGLGAHLCASGPLSRRAPRQCELPDADGAFETSTPSEQNLDPAVVAEAIAYAGTHNRLSIQIFRRNCLVATGALDPLTDQTPFQVFSVTKSVVSILTGMAYDQKKLGLDDAIDKYLPTGEGWGDAAHRAITIKQLLTETAGMRESILAEAATVTTETSIPQEALAEPLEHEPGTFFEYSQRVPDLLAFVVQQAVGQDLQEFAQEHLFSPIGIEQDKYFWLRDRSGNTYGYAWLFIPPQQLAKLGLLMQNDGVWKQSRLLSSDYVAQLSQPSEHNPCYGYLFWNNRGQTCTGANIPAAQTVNRSAIPSAPPDLYAMVGALHQNNFIIPSLDMTVTWTGLFGDEAPNLSGILSAQPADLYYNFFRILMRAVQDQHIPDPGPYPIPPLDLDVNPANYLSIPVVLNDLFPNPDCNVVFCNGTIPTKGLVENVQAIVGTVLGL